MASPTVLTAAVVKRFMREALAKNAGWPDVVGVTDESELYDPPEARTVFDAVPAHFGFPNNRQTVPSIVIGVGKTLLGEAMLAQRRPLNDQDLAITLFGPAARRAHLRLNGLVRRVVFEAVAKAMSQTLGHEPGEFLPIDPPPAWEGDAAFKTFLGHLIERLKEKVTHLPEPIISPGLEPSIRGAAKNSTIRNILLTEVVKEAVKRRLKAIES